MSQMQMSKAQTTTTFEMVQNQAKELLKKEIVENAQQAQRIADFFKKIDSSKLFKTQATISHEKLFTSADVDFVFCPIDLEYLKNQGLELSSVKRNGKGKGRALVSSDSTQMQYVEYYFDPETSYIIFVKYHFSHVKFPFNNGKSEFSTFVFVNSKSEVFYYDAFSGVKLLSTYETNMSVKDADPIFKEKKFEIMPVFERTYKLKYVKDGKDFEEVHTMKELNQILKSLLDILTSQYPNKVVPSVSELMVETKLLGKTENPVTVKSKVKISYQHYEFVEVTEKLWQYEITFYFANFPDQKVTATFQVTKAEKDNSFIFIKKYLKLAILKPESEDFEKKNMSQLRYEYLYETYIINQNPDERIDFSVQNDIVKLFFKNIVTNVHTYEHSQLQDTFKKVLLESCSISTSKFPKFSKCNQVAASSLASSNDNLYQTTVYSVVYQDSLYLVEVRAFYNGCACYSDPFVVYLPFLRIANVNVRVFKPVSTKEFDTFINGKYTNRERIVEDSTSFGICHKQIFFDAFPNCTISIGESYSSYKMVEKQSDDIYKKILECIQKPAVSKSSFRISDYGRGVFGGGDDDGPLNRIPIKHNGLIHAYFLDDGYNGQKTINSSFQNDFTSNSWSSGNDLLTIKFDTGISLHTTTLHHLLDNAYGYSRRDDKIEQITSCLDQYDIYKLCIDFLTEHQDEIFSD